MQVLAGEHSLRCCIGREHTLPTTGQGATMEYDEKSVVVGIGKDILIKLHHRLLVATEEIHLDTTNTNALHPCHLGATGLRLVHQMTRSLGSIVPCTITVIPKI